MSSPKIDIINFPEIRVVEASAGSGKTFALARRYVQLLLSSPPQIGKIALPQVLAITFTNKASYEMKSRILEFLKRIALKNLPLDQERGILGPLGIDRDVASKKAFDLMSEVIRQYNFFQVQTIDSFMNALLVGCAFKLGLSANFRIRHDAADYLLLSLDALIERAATHPATAKLFADFLRQYLFLENKTSWFPKEDIQNLLIALYQQNNFYGLDFVEYPLEKDLFTQKRQILGLMRELQTHLPEDTDARFRKSLEEFLVRYQDNFDFDRLSNYFSREHLPLRKGAESVPKAERLWDDIHARLKTLSEDEAQSLFNPYITVFNETRRLFQELASRDDVLFLEELNRRAQELFSDGAVTVGELYYRLATRIQHYLLDEFQDTSRLQWQNLLPMIEDAVASGGTLFYVGDKKQAIYSFRGGEPRLFDEAREHFPNHPVVRERLEINYRSRQAIVEFNNEIFSLDNLRRFLAAKQADEEKRKKDDIIAFSDEDLQLLENVFGNCRQMSRPDLSGGYVKVAYVDATAKDERDAAVQEQVIKLVKDLATRYAANEIAVLVRDNKDVEEVTSWLLEAGIPAESERTLNISENLLIREILAFLRFLDSPIDNRNFTEFLTGAIFSRATAIPVAERHAFVLTLRERISREKDLYVYKEFRELFPEEWDRFFDEFFRSVGLYPLYELVISILQRFGVMENFSGQQGFFMRFLELIREQEDENSDITSFLAEFENLRPEEFFVQVADSHAVKVLTVHKAKGLEFPVVIIPFLGMDVRVGEGGRMGQQSYLINFSGVHQELLRIKQKYLAYSPKLEAIYQRNYVQTLLSELNTVYVALTRAADEMYLFVSPRTGNSVNLVNFLIPAELSEKGSPVVSRPAEKSIATKKVQLGISPYQDWISYLGEEFGDASRIQRRLALRYGEVLHFLLSRIGNTHGQDISKLIAQSLDAGRKAYPQEKDWLVYEKQLNAILRDKKLELFFSVPGAEVQPEVEVVDARGQVRRIDRMIVTDNEVRILDYKTSREQRDTDKQQVQNYVEIVRGIYPGRKVLGYIFYFEDMKLVETGGN